MLWKLRKRFRKGGQAVSAGGCANVLQRCGRRCRRVVNEEEEEVKVGVKQRRKGSSRFPYPSG